MEKIVVMGLALSMLAGCPTQGMVSDAGADAELDARNTNFCGPDMCSSQPGTVCCHERGAATCRPVGECIGCTAGFTTQDTRADAFVDFDAGCFAR